MTIFNGENFASTLIAWQARAGRHDLPWQNTLDAYRIWLSEIMLQQTQVSAVLVYYQRFLDKFPDIYSLARATQDEVLSLWSGLGYYSRARNLHRCAQIIVAQFAGQFPQDVNVLVNLPGIGRSTAAAIAAFAWGKSEAILDGNVKRVLTRVYGIEGYPGEREVEQQLWALAESLLPKKNIEAYTQGLMDLGASLCSRRNPQCLQATQVCPFAPHCKAFQEQRTTALPTPKQKKSIPQRYAVLLLLCHQDLVFLERRTEQGIWGGLWSLPEFELSAEPIQKPSPAILKAAIVNFGAPTKQKWHKKAIQHTFTHFKLHIEIWQAELAQADNYTLRNGVQLQAWSIDEALKLGLPAPIRKVLEQLA